MYYEIFNGLITTVAESAVSAVVEQAVEWFFKKDSKKKDIPTDEDTPAVAVPLAIGYYYNFIEKIEERLAGDNFTVKEHYYAKALDKLTLSDEQAARLSNDELKQIQSQKIEMTKFVGRFEPQSIRLELIYPKQLTNPILGNCSAYLREKTSRGSIESTAGRPYGINFLDVSLIEPPSIKIVDYTRPVEVILKYYQEVKGMGGLGSDKKLWNEIQDKEMQAFLYTLKFLIENKSKFIYDKVYFRPYEN